MEPEQAAKMIQDKWRLHRANVVLDELLFTEVKRIMINRLRTLQRTFRVRIRKRFLELLVSEAIRRMERIQERERIAAEASRVLT